MKIIHTVADLHAIVGAWRAAGETTAMVPTMGALHAGHMSLVDLGVERADHVVATLFVNPKQFGPTEDLDRYPRDEDGDARQFAAAGVEILFMPGVDEIYPPGYSTRVHVEGLGDVLEGAYRPGFFIGVATVVSKLLIAGMPDMAIFGEKDFQQQMVIKRMVADLGLPIEIVAGATVREDDGLALSSRNAYLSDEERAIAPSLHRIMQGMAADVRDGRDAIETEEAAIETLLEAGFGAVDYLTVRDAESLSEELSPARPRRVLAAAWLGKTRLIDNIAV